MSRQSGQGRGDARRGTPTHERARQAAVDIVRRLRQEGHTAYLAGGCVRDELLGLEPKDFDVATDATPPRIVSLFPKTQEVGAAFGVVLVKEAGVAVEVATFRSDGPYTDRRRPDHVHFSDAKADAERRDFTINAIFLDPLASMDQGRIVDYVGGLGDLRAGIVRAVGDPTQRLAEDHLRALRAARFAARLGFRIDPETEVAIRATAGELAGVSKERIGDEVRKVLGHASRRAGAGLLEALELDGIVLGEPSRRSAGLTLGALPNDASPMQALAAWALDRGLDPGGQAVGKAIRRWRRSMCLSNEEADELTGTLGLLATLAGPWKALRVAHRKRSASSLWFGGALSLLRATHESQAVAVEEDVARLAATPGGLAPEPWVSGHDLIALGLSPGPKFKGLLEQLYDAQLEQGVTDRTRALELARRLSVGS